MRKLLLMLLALVCMAGVACASDNVAFMDVSVSPEATYVDLGDAVVTDFDGLEAFLDQLPLLEKFDMYATPMYAPECDRLAARYPNVRFGWTLHFGDHVLRTDATAFSTLHNSASKAHTSEELSIVRYCKDLLALDIGHNAVTDISFLYDMPQLKVLIIACNKITDASPVASLKNLEYLEVFKNKISDLTPFTGLDKLLDLNICFNYIKDWTPLHTMTHLERLWMYCSNGYSEDHPVPKAIGNAVAAALPDTHVDNRNYSTNGGWREHYRYFIINEMFQTGVYIPFPTREEHAVEVAANEVAELRAKAEPLRAKADAAKAALDDAIAAGNKHTKALENTFKKTEAAAAAAEEDVAEAEARLAEARAALEASRADTP